MHDFVEEENFGPISAIQERCHTLVFCEDAAGEKGLFLWELQRKLSSNHTLNIEAGILFDRFFKANFWQFSVKGGGVYPPFPLRVFWQNDFPLRG